MAPLILIAIRIHASAGRASMIATRNLLRLILVANVAISSGSVVGQAVIVVGMMMMMGSSANTCSADDTGLSVALGVLACLALGEEAAARAAAGVVVVWRWTIGLVLLVATTEQDLEGCGDEEETAGKKKVSI
jgi:hypothetical protein